MANESIVDQYIDSLFVFDSAEAETVQAVVSTVDSGQALVPTFKTPTQLGQFMLMAQQLLAMASQLPQSRLKQHCLNAGLSALFSGSQLIPGAIDDSAPLNPNLNELLKLNSLLR